MAAPYLRKVKGEYEVVCLGRNGEPFAKRPVKLAFKHRLRPKFKSIKLVTSKEGVIKLGALHDIQSIVADTVNTHVTSKPYAEDSDDTNVQNPMSGGDQGSSCKEWRLEHHEGETQVHWQYPSSNITLVEGENLELPIRLQNGETTLNRKYLQVSYHLNENLISDCFDNVKLLKGGSENCLYNYISLPNVQVGVYNIKFLNGNYWSTFKLTVLRGEKWRDDNFILQKNSITETCAKNRVVKFEEIKVEKNKNQKQITVKVKDVG